VFRTHRWLIAYRSAIWVLSMPASSASADESRFVSADWK
jgi:hypothetical protein